ncbi:GatB/GatE catalytic domain-domain-containing protein [Phakopsora pachyrhizi]|uniref:GatB/GatE catalytic domain-domain-containing protein n=1 Tax=Phakopsora pachyrhizi TaxID=170000 RepID=A0AAV0AGN3_PHAPC|nr:GatB/GatE catalytic domain-domain-containing protein [Phakopsora pachyrhizi]
MESFPAGLYSRGPRFLMMMIVFNRNSISWTQSNVFSAVERGTISSRIRGLETTTRSTVPSEPFSHQMNVSKNKMSGGLCCCCQDTIGRSALQHKCIKVQLEQDTAKLYKEPDLDKVTLIDLNRSGVGLIEIVAEPDLKMAKEASSFVRKLQTLLRFLGISKVNIEQGSLRCDIKCFNQKGFGVNVWREIYIPERPDSMIKRIWKDNGLRLVVVLLQMLECSESEEPKEPEDMDKGDFNISNE